MAATNKKAKAKKPAAKKATKRKAKKPAKKPAKKKPVTGQSGPLVEVPYGKLNDKEQQVVKLLNGKGKGARNPLTIAELAGKCFSKKAKVSAKNDDQANSWTRNSLRRLVCAGWVEKVERGSYKITDRGRKRIKRK